MNIFVTGGAGYIGSATAESLIRAGYSVTVYDSLVTGHRAAVPAEAEFVHATLDDNHALAQALTSKKYDAVMHFAAFIEAGESMKDPGKFFRNNLSNSLQLIETAAGAGVKKFVLSSTAAVYRSSDEPLTEESPLGPTNVYGHTKLMVEQTLEWYRQIFGLRHAALRYFNACGALPGRGEAHQPESHLIPRVLQIALGQAEAATIYGTDYPTPDGTCIRDYIHVTDLVAAHGDALKHLRAGGGNLVANCGYGHGSSVLEVIDTVKRVSGRDFRVVLGERRPGDPSAVVASPELIKSEFGWVPRHDDLDSIVASALAWETALERRNQRD
jgi:UDP-glucose 4-epimerase